jgi:hypothetical protein
MIQSAPRPVKTPPTDYRQTLRFSTGKRCPINGLKSVLPLTARGEEEMAKVSPVVV